MQILQRFKFIKTFVFDMDGVLTDGGLLIDAAGNWLRRMNVRDGYALQLAVKSGFNVIVLSGSHSEQVHARLTQLGITEVHMKILDKENFLRNLLNEKGWMLKETLFMGDDIPDLSCMNLVALATCPADASPEVLQSAAYISPANGGYGCVRDVIEKVLKLNLKWPLVTTIPAT